MQDPPRDILPADTPLAPADSPVATKTLEHRASRPYGIIGLTIGLILILVGSLVLCVLAACLGFGLAALMLGWDAALDRIAGLRMAAVTEDKNVLQAAGVVLSIVFYIALSAMVLAAARVRGGAGWRGVVGWHAWHPFRRSLLFWVIAGGTIAYSLAADAIVSRLYPPSKAWVTLPTLPIWAALFVALAVLFAPVAEELLFRGWLYTGLREKIGVWAAILISAVLFALAHWESTHIYALAVFPVGIALGFVRERTGSLKASMAFHAIYNAAASVTLVFGP